MELPWFLTQDPALSKLQTIWRSVLNPFIRQAVLNGNLIENQVLINGVTVVNHKLNKVQQGWFIADQNAAAQIYRSAAFNDSTLTLTSNAKVTVNLWVF